MMDWYMYPILALVIAQFLLMIAGCSAALATADVRGFCWIQRWFPDNAPTDITTSDISPETQEPEGLAA